MPEVAWTLDAADNQGMRLIERESQLAALHQYAKEASQGQGRLVLISGEAGVGKSVLLAWPHWRRTQVSTRLSSIG
jgi:predicted ATPase